MKKLLKRTKFLREELKTSLQQVSVEENEVSKIHDMKSSELYFQDEKYHKNKTLSNIDNHVALKKKLKRNQRRLPDDSDGEVDFHNTKRLLQKTDSNSNMNIPKVIQPQKKEISGGTYDLWSDDTGNTKSFVRRGTTTSLHNRKTPLPHPGQSYNPDPIEHQSMI